ncbi:DinB family protein [Flaviaesturariibacter aridisoli]|uniref:Damage-inducible protein DinB n=1 Tax=Flaviaesturariibacter aridisoli TaxID=2545761 RepID=A0A4R4DXP2_9BACT|nr:DinB family protein [Flaviaesturariibacter aridisoli]TCZ68293.1 damage-inducible protein DinB [Flaviaesturariibacter aridisoli]
MLLQSLQGEFEHEVKNTRKLLEAVPAGKTGFTITDFGWTMGQLAQHIATIYHWYAGTLKLDAYDPGAENLQRPDPSDIEATRVLFEKNVSEAREALHSICEEDLFRNWTMRNKGQTIVPPTPRIQVARGFLFNHLYHHRGELVIYLRAAGVKPPGLYGPTYEESRPAQRS